MCDLLNNIRENFNHFIRTRNLEAGTQNKFQAMKNHHVWRRMGATTAKAMYLRKTEAAQPFDILQCEYHFYGKVWLYKGNYHFHRASPFPVRPSPGAMRW